MAENIIKGFKVKATENENSSVALISYSALSEVPLVKKDNGAEDDEKFPSLAKTVDMINHVQDSINDKIQEVQGILQESIDNKIGRESINTTWVPDSTNPVSNEAINNKIQEIQGALQEDINNKVDKKDGKDLSTNDFTDVLKNKLEEIQLIEINSDWIPNSTNPVSNKAIEETINNKVQETQANLQESIGNKVDKKDGKDLSTNDFTDELKNKLVSIQSIEINSEWDPESSNPTSNKAINNKIQETQEDLQKSITEVENKIPTIDEEFNINSTNPVQNQLISNTFNDIYEKIEEIGTEIKPDWNAQYSSSPSYIYNRTHWKEDVFVPAHLEFLTTLQFNQSDIGELFATCPSNFSFEIGTTYMLTIEYAGNTQFIEYYCSIDFPYPQFEVTDSTSSGSISIVTIILYSDSVNLYAQAYIGTTEISTKNLYISIQKAHPDSVVEKYNPLDIKFLPVPNMEIGVEYLALEKFNNKQVYTKLIDFGPLPNNGILTYKIFEEEDNTSRIIRCSGYAVNSINTQTYTLPYVGLDNNVFVFANCYGANKAVVVRTNFSPAKKAYITIWYTKD